MPFENLLNLNISVQKALDISVKKDWVDYLSALLMPTVAVFGICIAYRQWRTEETRLRHELFERRYKQFDAVRNFVGDVLECEKNGISTSKSIIFILEIKGMEFIFDQEIKNYVDNDIYKLAGKIRGVACELNKMPATKSEEYSNLLEKDSELLQKILENLRVFEDKALKYMQLQQPSVFKKLRQHLAALWEKIQIGVTQLKK
jgi:hypothetical protein